MRLHLASLEAPLIAVLWAASLAEVHHHPMLPGLAAVLGSAVWLVYLLNGVLAKPESQDPRHLCRTANPLLLALMACMVLTFGIWLALWELPASIAWSGIKLALLVAAYLAVHGGRWQGFLLTLSVTAFLFTGIAGNPAWSASRTHVLAGAAGLVVVAACRRPLLAKLRGLIDKDVAGGVLFALGCTVSSRFLRDGSDPVGGFVELALLSCLFTANLTSISGTRSMHHRCLAAGLGCSVGALALVARGSLGEPMAELAWACAGGTGLLIVLEGYRHRLSRDVRRVTADVAIVAPALWMLVR